MRAASAASTHGLKVRRREIRKREQQIAEIALRVDADGRDAVDGGFFEQREAQARLAAAGHAHADRVRGEVLRVVEDQVVERRALARGIELAPEIENAELFVVLHGCTSLRKGGIDRTLSPRSSSALPRVFS